jgi:transcriptional regulator with XRE-family HTH domain
MNKKFANLQLHQMDSALAKLRESPTAIRPSVGWIKAIRESLGMSASAFARKLGITPASLRKLANALNCELQYTLVPRKSLEEILWERAITVAKEHLHPISHSMSLENQSVSQSANDKQLDLLAKEILDGPRRNLW